MIRYLCCILFVVAHSVFAANTVTLKPGFNSLDLNRDGINDSVVVAEFDNNTSHPNRGLTFFIQTAKGEYFIVPVANSDLFTWFDYRLSAASDFLIKDVRLYLLNNLYYLITAQKNGDDVFNPTRVKFEIYRLTESQDIPGVPRFDWSLTKKILSQKDYQAADDAYIELADMDSFE